MKKLAIVASHFTPSNLTSVHRARLWALHLEEFGWKPFIVTTHWKYYEESLDWELNDLVPNNVCVVRTRALPTKPLRIVGDIGIRSFYWHLDALKKLVQREKVDFVHITIPSNYSALLGRFIWKNFNVPYGIDYIDPWVHKWPGIDKPLSKAWCSYHLGKILEPAAVRRCKLITGVAPAYYQGVIGRNPHLSESAHTAAMPYGVSLRDFEIVEGQKREAYLFKEHADKLNFIYAGAMLPHAFGVLEALFRGFESLLESGEGCLDHVRFHFVGTGKSPDDPFGYNVLPIAEKYNLAGYVFEHPNRIPYTDVINHLLKSSAVLIVGSDRPHYTPSKVYQGIASRKPIFALLHERSETVAVMDAYQAGSSMLFSDVDHLDVNILKKSLAHFVENANAYDEVNLDWNKYEKFTARASAGELAHALNVVCE